MTNRNGSDKHKTVEILCLRVECILTDIFIMRYIAVKFVLKLQSNDRKKHYFSVHMELEKKKSDEPPL